MQFGLIIFPVHSCMEKEENCWMVLNFCRTFGGDYWGGVTVNALDGTIIDKDKGY